MFDLELKTEVLKKEQLLEIFTTFLLESGFSIIEKNYNQNPCIVKIKDNARKFEIHFIIKNISGGGWEDKKNIKRIQVGDVKSSLINSNKIRTHMLCGITLYKEKYILVVWNSYLYKKHATNRSCYIHAETIKKCYERGYVFINESNQDIWLCDSSKFGFLIRDYISYNYDAE